MKKNKNVQFVYLIYEFAEKLISWSHEEQKGHFAMFNSLADVSKLYNALNTDDAQYPQKSQKEFKLCLSKICEQDLSISRNFFKFFAEKVEKHYRIK